MGGPACACAGGIVGWVVYLFISSSGSEQIEYGSIYVILLVKIVKCITHHLMLPSNQLQVHKIIIIIIMFSVYTKMKITGKNSQFTIVAILDSQSFYYHCEFFATIVFTKCNKNTIFR